uniref:DCC-interacting protein 13-alpha-like n=1 Tax=Phallusia mammillata TaxID=59560 RepID=A0A6F9D7E8_9ASCI|nr:DCC-interacting protein 13-alpha-like [Phallusia mammillata]
MASDLLQLEDCLEDSPQTRALIGVYEKDSDILLQYAQELHIMCRRVTSAQLELTNSTQDLADKLRDFQNVKFVVGNQDEVIGSTLTQLVTNIDEISSYNAVLQAQLSESMDYHTSQFLNKDLNEYLRLKASFATSDKLHEEAVAKLARISKKKHNEKSSQEATDQLYASRKSFHNTSMLYCSCLNTLQNKKKIGLLRPVISFLQSQIAFFRMGSEVSKVELEQVLGKLSSDLSQLEKETDETRELYVEKMDKLDANSTRSYIPDPPASMNFPDLPVDRARTQISSYLFYRSRGTILSQWHRCYFFTQGGNLMMQSKTELAGQLFMDLDGCNVNFVDVDDRKHAFQVMSSDGRHSVILQAESKHKCEEWIATIRNIAAGLYLHDNPRQAAIKALKAQGPPDDNLSSSQSNLELVPGIPGQMVTPEDQKTSDEQQHSSSFESKHESLRPSMFERLKMAATSFMAPEEKPQRESRSNSTSNVNEPSESSFDAKIDQTEPILFDLPSPVSETKELPKDDSTNQTASEPTHPTAASDTNQPRHNPFTSEQPAVIDTDEAAFKAMFVVRFLGCRRVGEDAHLDSSIAETICHVMAARAYHKMFRMNELHLAISDCAVRLVDPATQFNRESFPASSVLRAKTLADNPRLLGFIVKQVNTSQLMCYTFESNADGDDVCCAINTARVMEQSKIEHEENSKQRQIENDLEAQSRMIAASETKPPEAETQEEVDSKESGDAA